MNLVNSHGHIPGPALVFSNALVSETHVVFSAALQALDLMGQTFIYSDCQVLLRILIVYKSGDFIPLLLKSQM
jgi:hypothetical protein